MIEDCFKSYLKRQHYYTKVIALFLLLISGLMPVKVMAQQYPVKLVPVVIPPYSLRLADYATSTDNKLQLQVLMTDLLEPQHQTGIKFSLEAGLNAVPIARSNDFVVGLSPFMLYPGSNVTLSNVDIRSLFELQNLAGINAVQYSKPLADGVYQFCFQAYDYYTKNNLSSKTCTSVFMVQYDPPMLTLPQNAEKIQALAPYGGGGGIVFQWMPRQIAPNTRYIFTLKELWDQGQSPISGFLSAPPLWREETYAPTLYYGIDKTQLMPGKRYAWQVQSKSGNPVLGANSTDDNGVYKNNGLSEIFYFDYVENCAVPTLLMAKNAGKGRVEIRWSLAGQPGGLYNVQYRKKGSSAEWATQQSYQATAILTGLEDKTEYEYRVGTVCGSTQTFGDTNPTTSGNSAGNAYSYSGIQFFTTDGSSSNNNYQCGIMPAVDIANKSPLQTMLGNNEVFTAGDFPVTVLSAQGSNGIYTGTGFIEVPYLADTRIKVIFTNIKLNTDKKLIEGTVETTYDPNETAVHYASGGLGETFGDAGIKEITVDYTIVDIKYTATPPPGKITIYGDSGNGGSPSQEDHPGGKDYEIKDKDGNIWTVDENGNVTKTGKVAEGGASNSTNTDGVSGSGSSAAVNQYTAKGIKIEWKEDAAGKFAYDTPEKTKLPTSKYPSVKDAENNTIYVPYKATVNKQTELFDAKVSISDPSLKDGKIIFKTLGTGKAIEATELNKTAAERNYQLKLAGTFDYAEEEVIAVLMPKDSNSKQKVIGSFRLVHLSPEDINVSLVPLDAASQSNLQAQSSKLNQIYNKIGVKFNVKHEPVLDISAIVSGDTIDSKDSELMSTYSPQQQQINSLYKGTDARYVLFVTDKKSSTGQSGYMRLNGQFGYVYGNSPAKTGAHELGHGVFKLEHPWKAYGTPEKGTNLLMDYTPGEELSHLDWKQVNDPAFKLYAFQGQSAGEFSGTQLTPEWEPFKFSGSSIYLSGDVKTPNGAVHGIAMCKNNDCSERTDYYWENRNGKNGYYAKGISEPLAITLLSQQEKTKNPAITLFWNYGTCGYNKNYTTFWNYIKDKKGFDLTQVTDANSIKYLNTVPCLDGSGSSVISDDICVGKDVVAINNGYNKLREIIDSNDKPLLVETIKNVDDCSLRLLSYTEIEKLIKKLGYDSTIKDDQESAIVRLAASIKTENFKTFYILLENNNNELIKNLVSHLQDRIILYGGNNYTNFMGVLVSMFNKYPASITDRWPAETDNFASRVINLNPVDYSSDTSSITYQSYTSKHNNGVYDESTGNIGLYDVYTTYHHNPVTAHESGVSKTENTEKITDISPLSPVIMIPNADKIPLIQSAIDGYDFGNGNYIVPAILLKYNKDKIRNDYIEKGVITTLDIATIYLSGGAALATKVTWIRRAWAMAEVAGAVGNIAVTTQTVNPDSNLGKAINAYNLGMGIIGVKNLSVGGYKFISSLPQTTKKLLQENKGLRDLLTAKYLEWKTLTTNLDNLSTAERELVTKQEQVWKALGIVDKLVDAVYKNVKYDDFIKTFTATDEQYKIAYKLWGEGKWDELFNYFKREKLNDGWPPFSGFSKINQTVKGSEYNLRIDRFQNRPSLGGGFGSPILQNGEGVDDLVYTYDSRMLATDMNDGDYYFSFKMSNKATDVDLKIGDVAPWFKKNVNLSGEQIEFSKKLQDIDVTYFKEIEALQKVNGQWRKCIIEGKGVVTELQNSLNKLPKNVADDIVDYINADKTGNRLKYFKNAEKSGKLDKTVEAYQIYKRNKATTILCP
ncbi:fibronectin type III domain-containing protein [Chryseobacterium tructae]|uniref:Fibronectin type III domain-containing protein n=2 Tax=Chryseobacterium tructae TaxID=1037380 RepID=A0ABV7XZ82_9FLAO